MDKRVGGLGKRAQARAPPWGATLVGAELPRLSRRSEAQADARPPAASQGDGHARTPRCQRRNLVPHTGQPSPVRVWTTCEACSALSASSGSAAAAGRPRSCQPLHPRAGASRRLSAVPSTEPRVPTALVREGRPERSPPSPASLLERSGPGSRAFRRRHGSRR